MTHSIHAIVDSWRRLVAEFRRWGATAQADALETAAGDLEGWVDEMLSPADAAKETPHLAESTIRNKLASGEIENHGKPGSPLVRRGDLWGIPDRSAGEMRDFVRRRVAGGR